LLVLLVMILASQTSLSSQLIGESRTGFGQVELIDWEVDGDTDSILVLLENRAGAEITIYDVQVESTSVTWTNVTLLEGARDTEFRIINDTGLGLSDGDAYRIDLTFNYVRADAAHIGLSSSGTISGTAGRKELSSEIYPGVSNLFAVFMALFMVFIVISSILLLLIDILTSRKTTQRPEPKKKMNLKEFLKPNTFKILVAFILYFPSTLLVSLLFIAILPIVLWLGFKIFIIQQILSPIIAYLLASILQTYWPKKYSLSKREFTNLTPIKGGIVAVLFALSILLRFIVVFRPSLPVLNTIELLISPHYIIYIFLLGGGGYITLFGGILMLIVFMSSFVYWYVLSCTIVWAYTRLKKRLSKI